MRNYKLVILGVLGFLGILVSTASAQSNLTYELRVGTTGENTLLAEFPESYSGEKVNIKLRVERLELREAGELKVESFNSTDFVFASEPQQLADAFDSIYSYTDEAETTWTVWRSNKTIKNRGQRVLVANAYKTFEEYVLQRQRRRLRLRLPRPAQPGSRT